MDGIYGSKDGLGGLKDSLMERVIESLWSDEYEQKQHSISALCSTVSSAMCQACFAGMRSVTECLATIFCPKPEFRHNVHVYERHTIIKNGLTVPLLSGHEQSNQNHGTATCFCSEDQEIREMSAEIADFVDVQLDSLPPLPPVPYESIPEEAFLRCLGRGEDLP